MSVVTSCDNQLTGLQDMLLESPVNKLFVSKQWYEETKNIFWEESMLDITNLTRGPVTLQLKRKAVLG